MQGNIFDIRNLIITQACRNNSPLRIYQILGERIAKPLHHSPFYLSLMQHRIDNRSHIVRRDDSRYSYPSGFGVHFNFGPLRIEGASSRAGSADQPLRFALIYVVAAVAWIVASDLLVALLRPADPANLWLQLAKGTGFIFFTGAALYWMLRATRVGGALRAIAIDPVAAQLVAIDVPRLSALAFATGGAIMAPATRPE